MTREEVITKICRETYLSRGAVSMVVDLMLDNISQALAKNEKVQFAGFGTFEPKKRAARVGRNPHTREAVPIPARIIPSFKPGKNLMNNVCRNIK